MKKKIFTFITATMISLSLFTSLFYSVPLTASATASGTPGWGEWDPKHGMYIGDAQDIGTGILRSVQLLSYPWQGAKASNDAGYGTLAGLIDGTLMAMEGSYFSTPGQAYNIISDRFTTSEDGPLNKIVGSLSGLNTSTPNVSYSYTGETDNSVTNYRVFTDLSSNDTYNYQWYNPITNNYNYTDYYYYDVDNNTYYYNQTINNNKYDYFYIDNSTYMTYYIIQTDEETGEEVEYLYNIFYKLPDGRSSFNLKKEDVWGQYLLYDTRPYDLVAEDDGKTLGLWHFNQDLQDSGYWGNTTGICGNLQYQEGMFEAGKFIPSDSSQVLTLYLDKCDFDPYSPYTLEWVENTPKKNVYNPLLGSYIVKDGEYFQDKFSYYRSLSFNKLILPEYKYVDISSYVGTNTYYAVTFDGVKYDLFINGVKQSPSSYENGIHGTSITNKSHNNTLPGRYPRKGFLIPGIEVSSDSIKFSSNNMLYERTLQSDSPSSSKLPTSVSGVYINQYNYRYTDYESTAHSQSVIDEMRLSKGVLYTDDYSVSAEPYTTNMVLAIPDDPKENEIFFYTGYAYDTYRLGGARPTYPSDGFIYVYLEDDIVQSVQQYQTNKWVEITGTIYKDGSAENLINYSLSDFKLHEPANADKPDDTGGTTSGNTGGNQGNGSGSGSGSGNTGGNTGDNTGGDDGGNWFTDFLGSAGEFLGGALRKVFSFLVDTVFGLLLELVDAVLGLLGQLLDMVKNAFSTITGFLNGEFSAFLASTFVFIPKEIWDVILLGVEMAVLAAVIKAIVNTFRS